MNMFLGGNQAPAGVDFAPTVIDANFLLTSTIREAANNASKVFFVCCQYFTSLERTQVLQPIHL